VPNVDARMVAFGEPKHIVAVYNFYVKFVH
jgi:hypothetical protein